MLHFLAYAYLYTMYKITKGIMKDTKEQRDFYKLQKKQELDAKYKAAIESWKARPWYERGIIYILWSSPIWVYILCRILLAK